MAIYPNITGIVKLCKSEGYGYIVPDMVVGAHDKDIFFHAESLENSDWSNVHVGQKVLIKKVISNRLGLQADSVLFI
jgi:cold shock CspA family protein